MLPDGSERPAEEASLGGAAGEGGEGGGAVRTTKRVTWSFEITTAGRGRDERAVARAPAPPLPAWDVMYVD